MTLLLIGVYTVYIYKILSLKQKYKDHFHCTFTQFGDTVEQKAASAFTAVCAHQVDTTMVATHIASTTLIYVCSMKGRINIS